MRILFNFLIMTSPISPRRCFIKNGGFKSLFKNVEKVKGEIESNFLNTNSGGLKLNNYLVQYGFDQMIQFGLLSKFG